MRCSAVPIGGESPNQCFPEYPAFANILTFKAFFFSSGSSNNSSSSSVQTSGGEFGWIVGCLLSKKKQKSLCFPMMQEEAAYVCLPPYLFLFFSQVPFFFPLFFLPFPPLPPFVRPFHRHTNMHFSWCKQLPNCFNNNNMDDDDTINGCSYKRCTRWQRGWNHVASDRSDAIAAATGSLPCNCT